MRTHQGKVDEQDFIGIRVTRQNYQMMNINKMLCVGSNQVIKSCADDQCNQPTLMCGYPRCKCSEAHKTCKVTCEFQPLMNQIIHKNGVVKKPLENLVFWYNSISRRILLQRDQLLKKIDTLIQKALDSNEGKLMQIIQEGKSWKLTGELMAKVVNSLKIRPSMTNNNLQYQIQTEVGHADNSIEDILTKIRKLWDTDKDKKEPQQKLRRCGIRWTWLNGKWIKPVPENFALSDLTGLGLDFLDVDTVKILSNSCPKLEGLQVGYKDWVDNSNLDDSCAQAIGDYLPQLKRLWIYNSPLSDKGAVVVSHSMKDLQYLILNNCKLTLGGKAEVRRVLPQCKKIQLL